MAMKKILSILFALSLTACATYHQFDCPYKEGARCLSVEEIDKKIDNGEIGHPEKPFQSDNSKKKKCHLFFCTKKESKEFNEPLINLSDVSTSPLRTEEKVLSLWVAPFYTQDGIYHEGHRIHFVAKEPVWKMGNTEIVEELL
jgi:type IV conjugative transfer system lipoprotein TraV